MRKHAGQNVVIHDSERALQEMTIIICEIKVECRKLDFPIVGSF